MQKIISLLVACGLASIIFAQKEIDRQHFIDLLKNEKYGDVFNECMQLRNDVYGKCAILDYFIAKSLCLDGHKAKSKEWLKYILNNYPLKDATRNFLTNDIDNCTVRNAGNSLGYILTIPLPQASVSGVTKLGPVINCSDKSQLINWEHLFDEKDLASRLFAPEEKEKAVNSLKEFLGSAYNVNYLNRFVIVTPASQNITDNQIKTVTTLLQKAFDFYTSYYNLRVPDKLITVYLMPDKSSLHAMALKIHGIDVGPATLGYSLLSDLSLLGIATPEQVGTLYHELFHLLVRTDAGDIPAFLDEGLASLYSVYKWNKDSLKGSDHTWRLDELRADYLNLSGIELPTLRDLFTYSWQEFNGGEDINLCKASVDYALSNHFMIYLQEKNLLQSLVIQFKNRKSPGNATDDTAKDNITIVEAVCNASLTKIQSDFEQWFYSKYGFVLYNYKSQQLSDNMKMEYYYMMFDEMRGKIGSLIYRIPVQNSSDKMFVDSAKQQLNVLNERFTTLTKSAYTYKQQGNMKQLMEIIEALKADFLNLNNKVAMHVKE